jgi:hypothetical protein
MTFSILFFNSLCVKPYKNENQKKILINKYSNYKLKAKVVSKNNNLELEILNIV